MNDTLNILCKLFIMFFFFISCKEKKTNSIPIIEIEKNIGDFNPFKLSDLNCELEYVVLETTPDAMLLDIRFVDISDDHIVVSDRDKCLLFDRSGKFLLKIGKKGRGPGENRSFPQVKIFNDKIFLPDGIENDIDGGINFLPTYAVNDKLIVSWFEAYQLKMYVASESFRNSNPKYPEKKKELEELAASLDENDNPVLMLVKLKE